MQYVMQYHNIMQYKAMQCHAICNAICNIFHTFILLYIFIPKSIENKGRKSIFFLNLCLLPPLLPSLLPSFLPCLLPSSAEGESLISIWFVNRYCIGKAAGQSLIHWLQPTAIYLIIYLPSLLILELVFLCNEKKARRNKYRSAFRQSLSPNSPELRRRLIFKAPCDEKEAAKHHRKSFHLSSFLPRLNWFCRWRTIPAGCVPDRLRKYRLSAVEESGDRHS